MEFLKSKISSMTSMCHTTSSPVGENLLVIYSWLYSIYQFRFLGYFIHSMAGSSFGSVSCKHVVLMSLKVQGYLTKKLLLIIF